MKALVTGANGHIGSNLVRLLSELGYEVLATVRTLSDTPRNAPIANLPNVELAELDVRDADRFRALCGQIDILFHLASTYAYYTGNRPEEDIVGDTLEGTEAAMRAAARQVQKVVLTSSLVALPLRRPSEPPATEADWQTDLSVPYFQAKTLSERRAWELAEKYAGDLVTLLPGAVCGPGFMRGTPSTEAIEGIMLGALRFGAPRMNFPIVDVRDVVRGHVLAAQKPVSGRFILCGDQFPTLRELSRMLRDIDPAIAAAPFTAPDLLASIFPYLDWLNYKRCDSPLILTPEFVDASLGRQFNASYTRARDELGWEPQVPLRKTLEDTMATIRALRTAAGRKI